VNWNEQAQWRCKTSSRFSEALVGIILTGYCAPYAIIPRSVAIIRVWLRVSTAPKDRLPVSGLLARMMKNWDDAFSNVLKQRTIRSSQMRRMYAGRILPALRSTDCLHIQVTSSLEHWGHLLLNWVSAYELPRCNACIKPIKPLNWFKNHQICQGTHKTYVEVH